MSNDPSCNKHEPAESSDDNGSKRVKLSHEQSTTVQSQQQRCFTQLVQGLFDESDYGDSTDARQTPIGNDLGRAKDFFEQYGFRTSIVQSPREALSIYKDSCRIIASSRNTDAADAADDEKLRLLCMLGMHPDQDQLESLYDTYIKRIYWMLLFCQRIRNAGAKALEQDQSLESLVAQCEEDCRDAAASADMEKCRIVSFQVDKCVARLIKAIVEANGRFRPEQLQREFDSISWYNATYANAHLQLWVNHHGMNIKEIYLKQSHVAKYERFTIFFYDPALDPVRPPRFAWMPGLTEVLTRGPTALARTMTQAFWAHLLRRGYYATPNIQQALSPELETYFLWGISKDPTVPLLLNAHFTPTYPLALYLYGQAGAGKSSLTRTFSGALHDTLQAWVDPEMVVRMVKQNLNKSHDVLQLELDLRPNNNDLSVMSIIQGRRLTMSQSKPGLVVVNMEEMPSNRPKADPNQLQTTQLISQRFSGRKGDYKEGAAAPRNSTKRGISGDASIICLFTSNYELEKPCIDALTQLDMFSNLKVVKMEAVSGKDRKDFAVAFLRQVVYDRLELMDPLCSIHVDLPLGNGDTRPLVRLLRMAAFFACALITDQKADKTPLVSVSQTGDFCRIEAGTERMDLRVTKSGNFVPRTRVVFDMRTTLALQNLNTSICTPIDELSIIVDFWLAKTLAPAVVVSTDRAKIASLIKALNRLDEVYTILNVDASDYKMMKSLYDPNDTPNLRDDILKLGRGALVAIELVCETADAQLCIREMIEDTPSMTAFSTERSALHKSGLFFCVYVQGDITPEIKSRASLIL